MGRPRATTGVSSVCNEQPVSVLSATKTEPTPINLLTPIVFPAISTAKRRGHAEATDVTIEILRDSLEQQREAYEVEIERLRERQRRERKALWKERATEQEKCDDLIIRNTGLAVHNEGLATENSALRREQSRGRLLELVATLLLGVGGGVVSYTTDQKTKYVALLALLVGGGVFALDLVAGLIIGAFPKRTN